MEWDLNHLDVAERLWREALTIFEKENLHGHALRIEYTKQLIADIHKMKIWQLG